jgi:hypothetical protein
MILLLVLLTCSWLALRSNKQVAGGALLGVVMALKLIAWPILLFLALRRKWRSVASGIAVALSANLIALLFIDFRTVLRYYSTIGKSVFMIYNAAQYNISTWAIGWKIFNGIGTWVEYSFTAPPLIHSPQLAQCVSLALPLLVLVVGIILANKSDNFDTSFAILVCVSVLVTPVAWDHYLVWMAIPIVASAKRLAEQKFPKRQSYLLLAFVLLFGIPPMLLNAVQLMFMVGRVPEGQKIIVPFAVGMITSLYTVGAFAMIWLLRLLDKAHVDAEALTRVRPAAS